ncbi:MAG: hypothetical protein AB7P08_17320 [Burkholderiales bacterium]
MTHEKPGDLQQAFDKLFGVIDGFMNRLNLQEKRLQHIETAIPQLIDGAVLALEAVVNAATVDKNELGRLLARAVEGSLASNQPVASAVASRLAGRIHSNSR